MTLSVVQPTDQELNARWPYWIRTLAAAINALEEGSFVDVTELTVAAGDNSLQVGVDISNLGIELIIVQGTGAAILSYIYNGYEGQVKIFYHLDGDISYLDGAQSGGHIYLNQPALTELNCLEGDIVALINVGGDGNTDNGYWKELWRTLSVK
jgi:hypothetical protein